MVVTYLKTFGELFSAKGMYVIELRDRRVHENLTQA